MTHSCPTQVGEQYSKVLPKNVHCAAATSRAYSRWSLRAAEQRQSELASVPARHGGLAGDTVAVIQDADVVGCCSSVHLVMSTCCRSCEWCATGSEGRRESEGTVHRRRHSGSLRSNASGAVACWRSQRRQLVDVGGRRSPLVSAWADRWRCRRPRPLRVTVAGSARTWLLPPLQR